MPEVNVGIIDNLFHPPIGVMGEHLDYNGPYSGLNTITQWGTTPGPTIIQRPVDATYGVLLTVEGAIPAGWGFTYGWVSPDALYDESTYDQRICQLVIQHQFLSGGWITTQRVDVYSFPIVTLWEIALPGRLGLLVAPGLSVDLSFLLVN